MHVSVISNYMHINKPSRKNGLLLLPSIIALHLGRPRYGNRGRFSIRP